MCEDKQRDRQRTDRGTWLARKLSVYVTTEVVMIMSTPFAASVA
jgi:hypothetical protein